MKFLVLVAMSAVVLAACQPAKEAPEQVAKPDPKAPQTATDASEDTKTGTGEQPTPDVTAAAADVLDTGAEPVAANPMGEPLWCGLDDWCWDRTHGFDAIAGLMGQTLRAFVADGNRAWAAGDNVLLRYEDDVWHPEPTPPNTFALAIGVADGRLTVLDPLGRINIRDADGAWTELVGQGQEFQQGWSGAAGETWGAGWNPDLNRVDIKRWTGDAWVQLETPDGASVEGVEAWLALGSADVLVAISQARSNNVRRLRPDDKGVPTWSPAMLEGKQIRELVHHDGAVFALGLGVFRYAPETGTWTEVAAHQAGERHQQLWVTGGQLHMAVTDPTRQVADVRQWDGAMWTTTQTKVACLDEYMVETWAAADEALLRGTNPEVGGRCHFAAGKLQHVPDLLGAWTDGEVALAVGEDGTILRREGTDATWTRVESPTEADLYDVWAGESGVIAVGELSTLARAKGPTRGWRLDPPPEDATAVGVYRSVWQFADGTAVVTGEPGTMRYDGEAWRRDPGTEGSGRAVWGSAPDKTWAAGPVSVHRYADATGPEHTTPRTATGFTAIWGRSDTDVFAVERGHVHHWDGATWNHVRIGEEDLESDHKAVSGNADKLVVCGELQKDNRTVASGIVRLETNVWTRSRLDVAALTDVWVSPSGEEMVVGRDGTILRRKQP